MNVAIYLFIRYYFILFYFMSIIECLRVGDYQLANSDFQETGTSTLRMCIKM